MRTLAPSTCTILLLATWMGAQTPTPRKIHIAGPKAFQLISLLASGSDAVEVAIKDSNKSEVVIHDLKVEAESTYKYDSDDAYYKLAIYHAWGKIGSATESTPIGEATALFGLLKELGLPTDLALEGTYFEMAIVNCKIDTTAEATASNRFQCEIQIGS